MTELNAADRTRGDGVVVAHTRKACPLAPAQSIGARSEEDHISGLE
jgi:hypothetical protein